MFGIGGFELFLILLFGFLIFGPDKLPAIAQTIGKGIAKFRNAQESMNEKLKDKSFIDKDSDEPFKNPLDVIEQAAKAGSAAGAASDAKKAESATDVSGSKEPISDEARSESFAERKARYDKERAERKAAEKAQAEKAAKAEEVAKAEAKRAKMSENPKADIASKKIVEEED